MVQAMKLMLIAPLVAATALGAFPAGEADATLILEKE